ncbi:hypothetical protein [Sagittula sp. MA-2]|jgi:hypothetical protein|uniref:hypothetical protein n=1 Tax=Sagittula sp. MA-2 TaxID=3048007 RepID=UPI0024C30CFE|nr:hypothetical protein [Sagittula sp. MA-2]WHZ35733.1 hypothetical protein QNI11_01715 [Sagittula sp. MA-2]
MWLLTITICLAQGQEAECQRHTQIFNDALECRKIGKAYQEYVGASEVPGVKLLFIGGTCTKGKDT